MPVSSSLTRAVSLSDILSQTTRAKTVTSKKVHDIRQVTSKLRILALAAMMDLALNAVEIIDRNLCERSCHGLAGTA